ncbi:hypothetical protein GUJ93_ZPchr0012g20070 [Zizania palustris]|uniref:Uncharacterized protein n=1 Tax=Zizania palustris TaxID=103762 RepID=A0A8J5WQ45_ZIZPA|nr:hypothetical protein GUJ93_ZPchr0012g20070 [Zizania palustris]
MTTSATGSFSEPARCAPFACRRGEQQRGTRTRGRGSSCDACGRPLGRAAGFVGGGIAAAFFASLERCYCMDVSTKGDAPLAGTGWEDAGEAAPLMPDAATAANKKKSTRSTTAGKGQIRGGFGCCENSTATS